MIRAAQEKDIPRLLALLTQVDMVHHRGRPDLFNGPATKYTESQLRDLLKDAGRPVFVWTDEDGGVMGYAFCVFQRHVGDNVLTDILTLYIDDLCVDENARGRGIGTALYKHVLAFAREKGCYNVTLNVWAFNTSALAFYQKCGLRPQKYGMETVLGRPEGAD